jgi:hypothetical protein
LDSKFKIGDLVTIVSKNWIHKNCDKAKDDPGFFYQTRNILFNNEMFKYCNKKYKIKHIKHNIIDLYKIDDSGWLFASWMFKEINLTDKIKALRILKKDIQ